MEFPRVVFGVQPSGFLEIRAPRSVSPAAQDYWTANWLRCEVEVRSGGFGGVAQVNLRREELLKFYDELKHLAVAFHGTATLKNAEGQLEMAVEADGLGGFRARCVLFENLSTGARLDFELNWTDPEMAETLARFAQLCAAFPVVGAPV